MHQWNNKSGTIHKTFTHQFYIKVSEECIVSEESKTQIDQMGRKISIQKEVSEGILVGKIELSSKEENLNATKQEAENIKIQPGDDSFQTKEIKESFAVEPLPSKLKEDMPTSEVANVDKTHKSSLTYSQTEAATMVKYLTIAENTIEQEKVNSGIESYFPVTVTENEEENAQPLDSALPKKDVAIAATISRKTSITKVIYSLGIAINID